MVQAPDSPITTASGLATLAIELISCTGYEYKDIRYRMSRKLCTALKYSFYCLGFWDMQV
ncbi:MAG: hypothetical protein U7123_11540 [Potamolinea sp.]